ncbi:flavodoxin, partial [Akkermansia sp. BIOML-A63]
MKKIFYAMALLSVTACFAVACSDDEPNNDGGNTDIEEVVPGTNHKILVAYFSEPL